LVIQFSDVPRGTRIMGRFGLTDAAVAVPDGAPVSLTIRAGQSERQVVAENQRGFNSYQLRLESAADDPVDVEFVITAAEDGRRHFCFNGGMQGIGARQRQNAQRSDDPPERSEPPEETQEGTGSVVRPIGFDLRPAPALDRPLGDVPRTAPRAREGTGGGER
jgi:hypothetical protein